jgi:MFS family permease
MSVIHPSCDTAVAHCAKHVSSVARPRLVLAATIMASGLAFVDGSVVNVALPTISRSLSADAGALQWVVNAYLLPLSALLLLGGAAGDHFGRRRLLMVGSGPLVVAAGFLLALRIDMHANYWTDVLPMIFVVAVGMSTAVAPLTTAVLTSVDARHTGSASGLNSAVARSGGLVATALLGSVLAATGNQLLSAFHAAMIVGAAACIAASMSAFGLLDSKINAPKSRNTHAS